MRTLASEVMPATAQNLRCNILAEFGKIAQSWSAGDGTVDFQIFQLTKKNPDEECVRSNRIVLGPR